MKIKNVLLVCGLVIASVLGGCGAPSSNDQIYTVEDSHDVNSKDQENNGQEESTGASESDDVVSQALRAYYEILSAAPAIEGDHEELDNPSFSYEENKEMFGEHLDSFYVYDINKDGVPELIATSIVNFRWTPVYVYTYIDGQAVLLKDPVQPDASGTFEQCAIANGSYLTFFCENNHIHSLWGGSVMGEYMEEDYAYTLEGTDLVLTSCDIEDSGNSFFFHENAVPNTTENISYMVK